MNYSLVDGYKKNNDNMQSDHLYQQYTNDEEESIIWTLMTIIIGILLGAVIGYFIFRDIKYIGPDSNDIVKNIFSDEKGRKYKYKPRITICPMNYSMNKLHNLNYKNTH